MEAKFFFFFEEEKSVGKVFFSVARGIKILWTKRDEEIERKKSRITFQRKVVEDIRLIINLNLILMLKK